MDPNARIARLESLVKYIGSVLVEHFGPPLSPENPLMQFMQDMPPREPTVIERAKMRHKQYCGERGWHQIVLIPDHVLDNAMRAAFEALPAPTNEYAYEWQKRIIREHDERARTEGE